MDTLKARPSPNCHLLDAPTSSYCSKCGNPFTEDVKYETESTGDAIRQLLRENPDAQNAFMDLLKELKK